VPLGAENECGLVEWEPNVRKSGVRLTTLESGQAPAAPSSRIRRLIPSYASHAAEGVTDHDNAVVHQLAGLVFQGVDSVPDFVDYVLYFFPGGR